MEVDGDIINLDITNEGNDIKNVVLEVNTTDISSNEINMLTNLTVEKVSDNEIKTSGDINISTNNESINLTLSLNNQNGYDLVEEKSFNNTKDINTLTDAEENEITILHAQNGMEYYSEDTVDDVRESLSHQVGEAVSTDIIELTVEKANLTLSSKSSFVGSFA